MSSSAKMEMDDLLQRADMALENNSSVREEAREGLVRARITAAAAKINAVVLLVGTDRTGLRPEKILPAAQE